MTRCNERALSGGGTGFMDDLLRTQTLPSSTESVKKHAEGYRGLVAPASRSHGKTMATLTRETEITFIEGAGN